MKKKISLVMAVMMLFSGIFIINASAAYKDVKSGDDYYDSITTLSKLGVIDGYEDETFVPQGLITRAEFTKMLVYVLGLQDIEVEPTEFSDIDDCWAKYLIKTAYDRGIIDGYPDGTFKPNDNVTYEQALKMVVCTLGYESHAKANGGYPDGYINQASALGLIKDITGMKYKDDATRGVIAQLVYNALEIAMKEYDPVTAKTTDSGETLLNDYLNVKKLKGILVGVEEYKTGSCTQSLNKFEMDVLGSSLDGEVLINFREYTQDITEISKYLGKNIVVYYRQPHDNDERMLVTIDDETTSNTDYNISFEQIEGFDGTNLRYRENPADKIKSLKFDMNEDVTVRYNGKVVRSDETHVLTKQMFNDGKLTNETSDSAYSFSQMLSAWLDPSSKFFIYGEVICTDRDSNGDINDIQINDYNTIVAVKKPTTSDYKISDDIIKGNSLILNPESNQYTYTIVKDGSSIPVTSINAGDVILYGASLDNQLYTCYATSETVTGSISSIDESDNKITVNDVEYDVGNMCRYYISTNQNGKTLSTGQTGKFHLDKYNTIVYAEIDNETEKPYAYVMNSYTSDDGETKFLSVFMPSSNSVQNYQLKDKVSVNGTSMSAQKAVNYLTSISADAISGSAVVRYSNNDMTEQWQKTIYRSAKTSPTTCSLPVRIEIKNNLISSLTTITTDSAAYDESGNTLISSNEDTSKIVRCKDLNYYKYSSSSFTLNNKTAFSINSKTTVIYVPGDRTERSNYSKKAGSSFTSGDSYYVEAYDINSSRYAGLVLMYSATNSSITSVSKSTNFSVVGKTPSTYFDEKLDSNTNKLSVYTASTTLKEWVTLEEDEFTDCAVGDVILFAYDSDNYAQDRKNIINYSDIASILNGERTTVGEGEEFEHEEIYNWAQKIEYSEANDYQHYRFDYRYPKSNPYGEDWYETYTSSSDGVRYAYSRAAMYNVMQIQSDENKLLVTQGGFKTGDEDSEELYDNDDYEEVNITSSTKILRMEDTGKSLSPYAEDTEANLTIDDFKSAQNFGRDCSKILVCSSKGAAKMIVIYK